MNAEDLWEAWPRLSQVERLRGFRGLSHDVVGPFWLRLSTRDQAALLPELSRGERRLWTRMLPAAHLTDVLQALSREQRTELLGFLDEPMSSMVQALLAFQADEAGGLMSPRFARVRARMSVEEALDYVRLQVREHSETFSYAYVLDDAQRLLGVLSLRELFQAAPGSQVQAVMHTSVVAVATGQPQEEVVRLFAAHRLAALPVVDSGGRLVGIVKADDIVAAMQALHTSDVQKIGGSGTLEQPYFTAGLAETLRKRASWLVVLFLSEMLTATAMAYFEGELARAVVLAIFIPLIISSGGNSGSQASTLVIRALSLGEIRLKDAWRVLRREAGAGVVLGLVLGCVGFARISLWHWFFGSYGAHHVGVAVTVSLSLLGVVLWGTLAGAMLPLLLRRLGFDPAHASAPSVATLVDVTGLVIYFSIASVVLRGVLL